MEYTLFFLAVLPGLLLIRYVYKLDSIEKEPLGLLQYVMLIRLLVSWEGLTRIILS